MRGFAAAAVLLLSSCYATRVADLERENARLHDDIEALSQESARLIKALERHKAHAMAGRPIERNPEDWNPDAPLPAPDPSRPDVILLSVDTLRADHLGAWGYERDTSPYMDKLAKGGTRFADTWAPAPWTLPSHTTMLSSLLPPNHGAIEDKVRIGDDIAMVQEAFSAAGYDTGAAVATLFVSRRFGFDRGFSWFHDFEIQGAAMNNASTVDAEHVFNWVTDWAQDLPAGRPIFLFVHVYDVHYGYNAPPPFNEKFDRAAKVGDALYRDYEHYRKHPLGDDQMAHQIAQYDEEIAYVDHALEVFLERWRATRPAVVAITSDHGEEFGERGSWGHAHTLFPEQLHVPLIVNGPGVKAQVVTERTGTEDIAVTLAGMAGVPFPAGDGFDRSTQLRSGGNTGHKSARFAETSRFKTLRYRWHSAPWDMVVDLRHAKRGICDLSADPACANTALAGEAARAEEMFGEMTTWLGDPWEARRAGRVQVKGGFIYTGAKRHKTELGVKAGDRFAVHPPDALVRFLGPNGQEDGPWAAIGGELPKDKAPVIFHGRHPANTSIDLTADEQELLEALGYIQDN